MPGDRESRLMRFCSTPGTPAKSYWEFCITWGFRAGLASFPIDLTWSLTMNIYAQRTTKREFPLTIRFETDFPVPTAIPTRFDV